MIKVELSKIIIDEKRQDQIIVLKECDGERQFPIVIGILEASSIKMKLAGVEPPRPLTHDLLVNLVDSFEAKVNRLVIDKLVNNTFHARIEIEDKDGHIREVDTRPSDGVALAVRVGASIFVEDEVMDRAVLFKTE